MKYETKTPKQTQREKTQKMTLPILPKASCHDLSWWLSTTISHTQREIREVIFPHMGSYECRQRGTQPPQPITITQFHTHLPQKVISITHKMTSCPLSLSLSQGLLKLPNSSQGDTKHTLTRMPTRFSFPPQRTRNKRIQ